MFQLEFYETEDGTELREPYSKHLGDGIFKLAKRRRADWIARYGNNE